MYCKLTDQNLQTYRGFQWQLKKWYKIDKIKRYTNELCSDSWFHCYNHPLLAVLFNPMHAAIDNPRLFQVQVKGKQLSDGTKLGFPYMKLIKELPVPVISLNQKIAFSILCAKEVYHGKQWNEWADNWLSGKDRGRIATATVAYIVRNDAVARTAAYVSIAATRAAAAAATATIADARVRAATVGTCAGVVARIIARIIARFARADAVDARVRAADTVVTATAAIAAVDTAADIDLIAIIKKAMEYA